MRHGQIFAVKALAVADATAQSMLRMNLNLKQGDGATNLLCRPASTMRQSIPPEIVSGAASLLKPYFPGLNNEGLVRALFATETPPEGLLAPPTRFLTVKQACKVLQVSKPTFYTMVRAGRLKTSNLTGERLVRVAESELTKLIQS